jgi:hypothetical protein
MRRLSGLLLAGAIVLLPALSQGHGTVFAQAAPQKTTFTGDMVLQAFAVNADKTADYEQVVAKLREALSKSERPETKQQLAGWKVMKNSTAQPDGSFVYIHVISPVVRDADYSIVNIVYEVFKDPAEQKAFYDAYRGALKGALFVIQGPITADFSK